jgi:hypothetical protein
MTAHWLIELSRAGGQILVAMANRAEHPDLMHTAASAPRRAPPTLRAPDAALRARLQRAGNAAAARWFASFDQSRTTPGRQPRSSRVAPLEHLQRKLAAVGGDLAPLDRLGTTGLRLSGVVSSLHAAPERYYLTDDGSVDLEAPTLRALEAKRYLLGERHGDGTWERRTAPWRYVPKMTEFNAWFAAESDTERRTIDAATRVFTTRPGLTLEDFHAKALTQALILQQYLGDYVDLTQDAGGCKEFNTQLALVLSYGSQYYFIAQQWLQEGSPPSGRGYHFVEAARQFDALYNQVGVLGQDLSVKYVDDNKAAALRADLGAFCSHLMELIDTRPFDAAGDREGADPLTNRAALDELRTGRSRPSWDSDDGLDAGNVPREAAMVRNLTAAPTPLLVQIGDCHVARVGAGLGNTAVEVHAGDDFAVLTCFPRVVP